MVTYLFHKIIPWALAQLKVQRTGKQTFMLEWNCIAKYSFTNKYKTGKEANTKTTALGTHTGHQICIGRYDNAGLWNIWLLPESHFKNQKHAGISFACIVTNTVTTYGLSTTNKPWQFFSNFNDLSFHFHIVILHTAEILTPRLWLSVVGKQVLIQNSAAYWKWWKYCDRRPVKCLSFQCARQ